MPFEPQAYEQDAPPVIEEDGSEERWAPLYRHSCLFDTDVFAERMMNFIQSPNLNTTWLIRGDILYDSSNLLEITNTADESAQAAQKLPPRHIKGMTGSRRLVRRLIPRNERRDEPMNQTCEFHQRQTPESTSTLLLYLPHTTSADAMPFYHPKVQGIALLHEWDPSTKSGHISVHLSPLAGGVSVHDEKVAKVAFHMLEVLYKHGSNSLKGYEKRVHHDVVVPQARLQSRLSLLKGKYARSLIHGWAEATDPTKHVFEDLSIAAFLMELWADMYPEGEFPGFVDIGCGNGLLVYLLNKEGYAGWGFDARSRKSWENYTCESTLSPSGKNLEERLLLPSVVERPANTKLDDNSIHDGTFPKGTFIVSNHADELTPWTPILATLSDCPFISIPCCSHSLTGDKYRPPPPRDKSKSKSTYASLVDWVTNIAEDCGWTVETEMLRIPSTRNTCLLGRKRAAPVEQVDVHEVIQKYGGVEGYYDAVLHLAKTGPRGH